MRNLYGHHFELKPGTWVYIPTEDGKSKGKAILGEVSASWKTPKNYFHLRSGGHVAAARMHAQSPVVASLDLERFFDQISRSRVARALKRVGFPYQKAWEFACDSTVEKKHLNNNFSIPFGFVQSPILSSICLMHSHLGREIAIINRRINVSVYVDDITISGTSLDEVGNAFYQIKEAAKRSGFSFNKTKTQPPSSSIFGFNIIFGSGDMRITDERMVLLLEKFQTGNEYQKMGISSYIRTVNQDQLDALEQSTI